MPQLHKKKVRMFYHNFSTSDDVLHLTAGQLFGMGSDEDTLSEIRSIKLEVGYAEFLNFVVHLMTRTLKISTKRLSRENFNCCLSLLIRYDFLGLIKELL